ncbi:MAG: hypothetical protein GX654_14435 [Desulfatiglans sp.]|mgnify:CR=1 FL=1|nr:hypothetical protein [Desulfatiglans sp.]
MKTFIEKHYLQLLLIIFFNSVIALPATSSETGKTTDQARQINDIENRLEEQTEKTIRLEKMLEEELRLAIIRRREKLRLEMMGSSLLSETELNQRIHDARSIAAASGKDISAINSLFEIAGDIIKRADFKAVGLDDVEADLTVTQKISGLIETGITEEEKAAHARARVQEYKSIMYRRLVETYINCLLEDDPAKGVLYLRSYSEAIRSIQSGDSDALAAQAEDIAASHQLAADLMSGVPLLGDAIDWISVATGENPISGEQLEGLSWAVTAGMSALGPLSLVIKSSPAARNWMGQFVEGARNSPEKLARALGSSTENITALGRKLDDLLGTSLKPKITESAFTTPQMIKQTGKIWDDVNKAAAESIKDLAEKIGRTGDIDSLLKDPDFLALYQKVRSNPRSVLTLKNSKDEILRNTIFDFEARLFGDKKIIGAVDQKAISSIKDDLSRALKGSGEGLTGDMSTGMERIRKNIQQKAAGSGKTADQLLDINDPSKWDIEVYSASNKIPERGTIGSDRDVTYLIKLKDGNGSIEMPVELVRERYAKSLYEHLNPGKAAPDSSELGDWLTGMDHSVVDGMQTEAYSVRHTGKHKLVEVVKGNDIKIDRVIDKPDMEITDFLSLKHQAEPGGVVAEGISDTFRYKGNERFDRAAKAYQKGDTAAGMINEAEGMRQIVKQYDNLISANVSLKNAKLSPFMEETLNLMRQVEKGQLSPVEVKARLEVMTGGLPPDEALELMTGRIAEFYEALHKLGTGGL